MIFQLTLILIHSEPERLVLTGTGTDQDQINPDSGSVGKTGVDDPVPVPVE